MKHYVYVHYRKDNGLPFYVGKGVKDRKTNKGNRNSYWHNMVKKYGFKAVILFANLDEELALLAEMECIDAYRKRGVKLVNMTDGGDKGVLGLKHSIESKQKMSLAKKGKTSNRKGLKMSKESKEKISLAAKNQFLTKGHPWTNKTHSPETKAKISLTLTKNKIIN